MHATATQPWPLPPLFAFVKTHAWGDADPSTREAFGELIEQLGDQAREVSIDSTCALATEACKVIQDVEFLVNRCDEDQTYEARLARDAKLKI